MAYAHPFIDESYLAISRPASRRPGLFRRFFDGLMAARLRQAEREIAKYVDGNGGRFTDETEREIERRFLSN
jgi:hypothetical protein